MTRFDSVLPLVGRPPSASLHTVHSRMQPLALRLTFAALLAAAPALAQSPPAAPAPALGAPLPVDSQVTVGTLPNGLRYYIRVNRKPEHRAELRLVVNAGSVLEDEDQRGMAHFLEHMAFNGTTRFAKNELVSYLQSIGVRFGADLNAGTSFDETIYILPIPTDTARIVERAFDILEDWAHGQTLDSAQVASERGVVLEEWRLGQGAEQRMLNTWLPVALKGSRYAERVPIGTRESIERASPAVLRRFYRQWYRPDEMAVIAVGDFDQATLESLIRRHFSGLTNPVPERPRALADVPDNRAPLIAIATDPEATASQVALYFKRPVERTATVADFRRGLVARLYTGMLNNRFEEMAQKPDAPFLGAGASKGRLVRSTDAFILGADVPDGGIPRGLEALLVEARRVDRFGFLPSELEREKQDVLRGLERAYAERATTNSSAYVQAYVDNFLTGEPIPGIGFAYDAARRLLPTITLAEVNRLAADWITDSNRVVIATAPQKPGVPAPTEPELAAVFARAAQAPVTAYTETLSGAALVARAPVPGRVVAQRDRGAGVTEWTLSNGARVLLKPTDFKADEVLFTAYSPGGTGLASDRDFMSAVLASQIVALSGVGGFSRVDLQKKLAGRVATVTPSIGETSEGLDGRASPKDLETLLQLVYLHFTAPRLDTSAVLAFRNQVTPFLENRGADPGEVFADTVNVTMAQHHRRARPFTVATFTEVDPARAFAFYTERFADAGDFTFVFVGRVTPDSLRPLVERYLASLPTTRRTETWRDVGVRPPPGIVQRTVRKGVEPKAETRIFFTGPFTYTPTNRFALRALTELVQLKLDATLREQLGGTYSARIASSGARVPYPSYVIQITYGSAPANVELLTRSVFAIIDSVKATGASAADLSKVQEQMRRAHEVSLTQNGYWLQNIAARDQAGEPLDGILSYHAMITALTAEQIRQAARTYLDTTRYARFVLLPDA